MRHKILSLLALFALAGCATMPTGPSVRVLPGPDKPFEQFMTDDTVCRQWAAQSIGMSSQHASNLGTAKSAGIGTAIGAGAGALIGAAAGSPGAGAAIGGGSGLLLGTATGSEYGREAGGESQTRYDNAYVQCMYAKGNQVPGVVTPYRGRSSAPPAGRYPVPPDYRPPR